jgi:hypothetical protein
MYLRTIHSLALSVPFLHLKPSAQNSFAVARSIQSLQEPFFEVPANYFRNGKAATIQDHIAASIRISEPSSVLHLTSRQAEVSSIPIRGREARPMRSSPLFPPTHFCPSSFSAESVIGSDGCFKMERTTTQNPSVHGNLRRSPLTSSWSPMHTGFSAMRCSRDLAPC